jgi:hypothetical protein
MGMRRNKDPHSDKFGRGWPRTTIALSVFALGYLGAAAQARASTRDELISHCTALYFRSECAGQFNAEPKADQNWMLNACRKQGQDDCAKDYKAAEIFPHLYVLTIIYAPPGCKNTASFKCPVNGSVEYTEASSAGSKVSIQSSLKNGLSMSASVKVPIADGVTLTGGIDSSYAVTVTDTYSESVTKSAQTKLTLAGSGDGIDHDQDRFVVLLNPAIATQKAGKASEWTLGYRGKAAELYVLKASWLKRPDPFNNSSADAMPATVATLLKAHGVTADDLKTVLGLDPLAMDSSTIDPGRYVQTTWMLPYEPLASSSDTCVNFSKQVKNDLATENSESTKTEYTIGASAGLNAGDLGFKATDSITWSNSVTITNATSSSNTANLSLACPSNTWGGPTQVAVYWDMTYGTFMFALQSAPQDLLAQGVVLRRGQPVAHQRVDLSWGGRALHTVTDRRGRYAFYALGGTTKPAAASPVTVSAGALRKTLTFSAAETRLELAATPKAPSKKP